MTLFKYLFLNKYTKQKRKKKSVSVTFIFFSDDVCFFIFVVHSFFISIAFFNTFFRLFFVSAKINFVKRSKMRLIFEELFCFFGHSNFLNF